MNSPPLSPMQFLPPIKMNRCISPAFPILAPSFSWQVKLTAPNVFYISKRFRLNNLHVPAFWLEARSCELFGYRKVVIRIYKDCPKKISATIEMAVNGRDKLVKHVNNWTEYHEFTGITIRFEPDALDITCSITIHDFLPTQFNFWKQFHLNPELNDLLMIINDEKLPVHRIVLAAQSPVFLRMFRTDMKEATENRIELNDEEADGMKEMIEYFYTGKTNARTDVAVALKMLHVAHRYEVKHLQSICELTLISNLTEQNVLEILDIAETLELPELRSHGLGLLAMKKELTRTPDFRNIVSKHPNLICDFICSLIMEFDHFERYAEQEFKRPSPYTFST